MAAIDRRGFVRTTGAAALLSAAGRWSPRCCAAAEGDSPIFADHGFATNVPSVPVPAKIGTVPAETASAPTFDPSKQILAAPDDPALWLAYREALAKWRRDIKARLKYDDALYARKEFAWSASNYACCLLMTWDETFYDWRRGHYTVDAFLDHGQREFGGYDSVVLWHAYPRIGVDERNQFDFYRDLPGGRRSSKGTPSCGVGRSGGFSRVGLPPA